MNLHVYPGIEHAMLLNPPLSIILLAEPGYVRDGMVSILKSFDIVGAVKVLSPQAYLQAQDSQAHTDIVLIGCAFSRIPLEMVSNIKNKDPHCRLVAIVENIAQVQAALNHGADAAIVEDYSQQNLLNVMRSL